MRSAILAAALALAACATVPATPTTGAAPACALSAADREWVDGAFAAWRFSAAEILGFPTARAFDAVIFDGSCVLSSANAFTAASAAEIVWTATPHTGEVTLPGGQTMPVGVTSFAGAEAGRPFFVMSTPSVWNAGGVTNAALGLETMMTAVFLHEAAHAIQFGGHGPRIAAIEATGRVADDDINDDMIQHRFGADAEFTASVQRETDLLFQIVGNRDEAAARRLARQALDLMGERRARYFTGDDAFLADAEDTWLTLEGSGQWLGYQWVAHPSGGGAERDVAMRDFARRTRWWSQNEGIALAFAVDRLADFDWKREAFGGGSRTLTDMLEAALAEAD